jgi:hypothetical protein
MINKLNYVLFIGALHHFRYVEYICRYFNLSEKDLIIYFFLNDHQNESNLRSFNTNKNIRILKESSFFTLKYILKTKNKFIDICEKDFSKFDKIKLFSSISYDYSMVFKSIFTNTELSLFQLLMS